VPDALSEQLVSYFAQRQAQRAEAVDAFLAGLTDYERGLFYDAAVMGYVRGSMHPRDAEIPLNKAIVADVVNACFAHSDLYPAVNADFEDRRTTVEYFIQGQQPDGTWEQCSSTTSDVKFAVARLAARRRMQPEFVYRLARRTTRVIVEAERTPEA
jgi:hypothetical protein